MRCVFVGTPAYLGRVDGPTRCAFWAEAPQGHDFDPARLIEVDLACTPSAAEAKEIGWDEVQVDDCFTPLAGPAGPELRLTGGVYLERDLVAALPAAKRPTCPPRGMVGYEYEYLTTVYWPDEDDPRAGRRYAGHYAEIVNERGPLARVAVYPPRRSAGAAVMPVAMWMDLTSPEQCDAGPYSLTAIGVGDAPKRGALFLATGLLSAPSTLDFRWGPGHMVPAPKPPRV
jgi:hypothetical protein